MKTVTTAVPDADWRIEIDIDNEAGDPKVSLNGHDLSPALVGFYIHWTRSGNAIVSLDLDCFPKITGYADISQVRMESRTVA